MSVTNIVTWVLRVLVAAAFLFFAFMKLSSNPQMVAEFNTLPMAPYFIYVTGLAEVIGALLVLNPRTTPWGCLWLLCVLAGAFLAQIGPLHGDVVHVIVIAGVVAVLFFLTRHPVLQRIAGIA